MHISSIGVHVYAASEILSLDIIDLCIFRKPVTA